MAVYSFILCLALTATQNRIKVDLAMIAGKTRQEVEIVLGAPSKVESFVPKDGNCNCQRIIYLNGKISLSYFNGKAEWIKFYPQIEILNLHTTKILAYSNWRTYAIVNVSTLEESECCEND